MAGRVGSVGIVGGMLGCGAWISLLVALELAAFGEDIGWGVVSAVAFVVNLDEDWCAGEGDLLDCGTLGLAALNAFGDCPFLGC